MPDKKKRVTLKCQFCGKDIVGLYSQIKHRKYCSRKCVAKGPNNYFKTHNPGKLLENRKTSSERMKGYIPWNKGIPRKEETKRKISEANKGKISWCKGLTKKDNPDKIKWGLFGDKNPTKRKEVRIKISKSLKLGYKVGKIKISGCAKMSKKGLLSGKNHPMYGKKSKRLSEWNKKYKSAMVSGKGNPNWRGGISFELYGTEFNKKLKNKIIKRDNYICQICGIKEIDLNERLTIHHIDYDKKNNNLNNLISLCRNCHGKTNFNREYWKQQLQLIRDLCNDTNLQYRRDPLW